MKNNLAKPCNACPFRRASAPGWLGPWTARDLLASIPHERFPCHKTIDDPLMSYDALGLEACAGALIYLNNKAELSRDGDIARLQRLFRDAPEDIKASVFKWPWEFLEHHKSPRIAANAPESTMACEQPYKEKKGEHRGNGTLHPGH